MVTEINVKINRQLASSLLLRISWC